MWNLRKQQLDGALAFYKIGHHGSVNATPWGETPAAQQGEPLAILNAILPVSAKAKAKAIVSTHRGNYPTIPRSDLLAEIGKRVSNTKDYATRGPPSSVESTMEGRREYNTTEGAVENARSRPRRSI